MPRVNGHSKDPVNVPINASWYQKEDYPEETNHVNGSSANKPQPQKYPSLTLLIYETVLMISLILILIPILVIFQPIESDLSFAFTNTTEL